LPSFSGTIESAPCLAAPARIGRPPIVLSNIEACAVTGALRSRSVDFNIVCIHEPVAESKKYLNCVAPRSAIDEEGE